MKNVLLAHTFLVLFLSDTFEGRRLLYSFPGIADETTYVLRHLTRSIFLREALRESIFARQAQGLVLAVLVLSHIIAEKAGLTRNIAPGSSVDNEVIIPRSGSSASPVLVTFASYLRENPLTEQLKAGSSIARTLDHFQPVDVPLSHTVAVGVLCSRFAAA